MMQDLLQRRVDALARRLRNLAGVDVSLDGPAYQPYTGDNVVRVRIKGKDRERRRASPAHLDRVLVLQPKREGVHDGVFGHCCSIPELFEKVRVVGCL